MATPHRARSPRVPVGIRMRLIAIGAIVGLCATAAALHRAGDYLVVTDPLPATADAIVVLAGSTTDRALEAADLWHRRVAPLVILTQERRPPGARELHRRQVAFGESHEVARSLLETLGVPGAAIVTLRGRAHSTRSEADRIAAWACTAKARSIVVVTSPSHTRRAGLILRRALPETVVVTMRPSTTGDQIPSAWYRERHAAMQVLYEVERLAHHWLVERWDIRPCSFDVERG